ncbi:MAG: hypothetical protein J0M04_12550 [Verrucomicrobia bacterium]|nr:hypothetical protein [Verrucomicrobiota bacterium]
MPARLFRKPTESPDDPSGHRSGKRAAIGTLSTHVGKTRHQRDLRNSGLAEWG